MENERRANAVTREEFDTLKTEVATNTALTREIHDMLRSFKLLGSIAKWLTTVAAGLAVLWKGATALFPAHTP
jgi:hypothetical protein